MDGDKNSTVATGGDNLWKPSRETSRITNRILSMTTFGDTLLVSGISKNDGIFNLATSVGEVASLSGRRVVVIDAGLTPLQTGTRQGWVQTLTGQTSFEACFSRIQPGIVKIVHAGSADEFQTTRMLALSEFNALIKRLKQITDLTIIVTPAQLLSPKAELAARVSQGVVLGAHKAVDSTDDLETVRHNLELISVPLLGVVLIDE